MTYEEFQAGLAETPELLDTVLEKHEADSIKRLTEGKKMVVTTEAEAATNRQKIIDDTTKTNHTAWETKIEAISGETRPKGVNGLTWLDSLIADKKLTAKEEKGTPEGDAATAATKLLQEELKTLKKDLADKDKAVTTAKVDAQVNSGIRSLPFAVPGHLKAADAKTAYLKDQVSGQTALFNAMYDGESMANGTILFKDKQGNAQVNTAGDPLTVTEIFEKNHAHLLTPKSNTQGGSGSQEDENVGKGNADYLGATTEDIRKAIADKGISFGTDKWSELYTKAHIAAGYVKKNDIYVKP